MDKTITYDGQQVSVSEEVAEFLEADARKRAAQGRSNRRHLSRSNFETAARSRRSARVYALEDEVIRNLSLQNLRKSIASLCENEQRLIQLYFYQEMNMEQVGKYLGISKMAVSKRLKTLYGKMRDLL